MSVRTLVCVRPLLWQEGIASSDGGSISLQRRPVTSHLCFATDAAAGAMNQVCTVDALVFVRNGLGQMGKMGVDDRGDRDERHGNLLNYWPGGSSPRWE